MVPSVTGTVQGGQQKFIAPLVGSPINSRLFPTVTRHVFDHVLLFGPVILSRAGSMVTMVVDAIMVGRLLTQECLPSHWSCVDDVCDSHEFWSLDGNARPDRV